MWGGADYERVARRLAPFHDELATRLAPRPGERWLDVGTGTGELALRAARAGAEVTGVDIAERLLAQARAKAAREGLTAAFEVGDAQRLPYDAASFDVAASSFAVMFAPDAERAADELARVVRPGGRLGVSTWAPSPELDAIFARFQRASPSADIDRWGDAAGVELLLGDDFELEVERGVWSFEDESLEALWEFAAEAVPPSKAFLATLDDEQRAEYRAAMLEHWSRFVQPDGTVAEPREYLLVLGTRR